MTEQQRVDDFYADNSKNVLMEKRIWGFIIHLKQDAVDRLNDMLDILEHELEHGIRPGKFRTAVCEAIKLKQYRLQAVTRRTGNHGCKLVSPWPIPFALTVMKEKNKSDEHLYFSVFNPDDNTWSEEADFSGDGEEDENDVQSASGPALAEFDGKLFCVHRGKGGDTNLYWETYTTDTGWSYPQQFSTENQTNTMPALVVFEGQLYCFYRQQTDSKIYFCKFDGHSWIEKKSPFVYHGTTHGPAVAVMDGKLYVGHRNSDKFMYIASSTDLNTWTQWAKMNDNMTSDSFNLVFYKNQLHTFFKDTTNNNLWYTCGTSEVCESWSRGKQLPAPIASQQGPGMCFFETPGFSGGHVYMIHRAKDTAGKLYWSRYSNFDGNALNATPLHFSDNADEQHCTADNPALAVYHDPQGADPDEGYVDPADAGPRLICVYRGA